MASLYKDSLVAPKGGEGRKKKAGGEVRESPNEEEASIGGNGKGVLILVDNPGTAILPDSDLEFLLNILKACRFGLDDVAIANLQRIGDRRYGSLIDRWKPDFIILFGRDPAEISLPLAFPAFRVQRHGPVQYLHAPDLMSLKSDDAGKRSLWVSLKQMFGIA